MNRACIAADAHSRTGAAVRGVLLICISMHLAAATDAGAANRYTLENLETRWKSYLQADADSEPAMTFPYTHCFKEAALANGIPVTLLLAVARGESDFEPRARSHANAYGLMQILWPDTARHLGIRRLSELLDPCTNVEAGARYLKEMLVRYKGNLHRALAAYNYGPGRIPVTGGAIPDGAVWYSGYIMRHLDYVLTGGAGPRGAARALTYSDRYRIPVIRFSRPYRATAFIENLQPRLGGIRLDWFRRADGSFDVVMICTTPEERGRGERVLEKMGF
jgi:hypothetical protein